MLAAAEISTFVFQAVNSSRNPMDPSDLQAGLFFAYYGNDVKDAMQTCFGADQKAADTADEMIADIKAKDVSAIKQLIQDFTADIKPRVDNCDATNPLIHSMYDNQSDTIKAVQNDPDWQVKLLPVVLRNKATVTAGIAAAESKWDSGDAYGAGQEIGKIEKLLLAKWAIPLATDFLQ